MDYQRLIEAISSKIAQVDPMSAALDPARVSQMQSESLLYYYGNIHSQRGQDGILAEIFRRINIPHRGGYFVEFGAWDGIYLSNARYLFEKGWSGCFIEANKRRYDKLTKFYSNNKCIKLINAMVGAPGFGINGSNLGSLLSKFQINTDEVTFVSIDVDGPDLEICLDMGFKPPVVLLEGGFNFSPYYDRSIDRPIAWNNIQQPLAFIISEAKRIGYSPVCFYQDTYLVRSDLVGHSLSQINNDPVTLYKDAIAFMPNHYYRNLLTFRENSSIIKNLETEHFGLFKPDPLAYNEVR